MIFQFPGLPNEGVDDPQVRSPPPPTPDECQGLETRRWPIVHSLAPIPPWRSASRLQ